MVKYISLQFTTLLCEITNKEAGVKCGNAALASPVGLFCFIVEQLHNCVIRHSIVCTLMLPIIFPR